MHQRAFRYYNSITVHNEYTRTADAHFADDILGNFDSNCAQSMHRKYALT